MAAQSQANEHAHAFTVAEKAAEKWNTSYLDKSRPAERQTHVEMRNVCIRHTTIKQNPQMHSNSSSSISSGLCVCECIVSRKIYRQSMSRSWHLNLCSVRACVSVRVCVCIFSVLNTVSFELLVLT